MSILKRQKGDDSWNAISVYQYNQLKQVLEDQDTAYEDKVMDMIEIVYNVNPYTIPLNEFGGYVEGLAFVQNELPEVPVYDVYELNGTRYVFVKDIQNISVAQYLDYSNYIQDDPTTENYARILSIFLIPEGFKYNDGYDILKAQRDIDQYLSIVYANAISAFFLAYYQRFIKTFLRYLKLMSKRMKRMKKEEREAIHKQIKELEKVMDSFLF